MLIVLAALLSLSEPAYTIQTFECSGFNAISAKGAAIGSNISPVVTNGQKLEELPAKVGDAFAIDDDGGIAGSFFADDHDQPFVRRNGNFTRLPTLGEDKEGVAYAVNSKGVIAGVSGPYGRTHAVLWGDEGLKDLGVLTEHKWSIAYGINDAGWIAGRSSGKEGDRPFLYKDGKMDALPLPEGHTSGFAKAINRDGIVVGFCNDEKFAACRWDASGAPELLGVLPGQYSSEAVAINSAGDIVGKSGPRVPWLGDGPVPKEIFQSHVFLWRAGKMYDLTAMILKQNPRLFLYQANGINDAGQIVGDALLDGKIVEPQIFGKHLGFILTPKTKGPGSASRPEALMKLVTCLGL